MIKKITSINNVYSYSFFKWNEINVNPCGDDIFKKNNIIFGENGNGKSNLIKIFKHLNGESVNLKKHWDLPDDNQEIEISLKDDIVLKCDGTTWDQELLKDKFIIFDKHFTEKFVHSIGIDSHDTPDRKKKRGGNIVYLGNFVEYNSEIDKIIELSKKLSEDNKTFQEKIEQKILVIIKEPEMSIDGINKEDIKEYILNIDESSLIEKQGILDNKIEELKKIDNTIKDKDKIVNLPELKEIDIKLDLEDIDPVKIFDFTISAGIQTILERIESKKDFIKDGINLLSHDELNCPFCEQKIKNGEFIQIIKDYKTIFNKEFEEEETQMKSSLDEYEIFLETIRDLQCPTDNTQNLNKLQNYIEIKDTLTALTLTEEEKILIKQELSLVKNKKIKFLDKMEGTKITEIKEVVTTLSEKIKTYNDTVKSINTKLEELKDKVSKGEVVKEKDDLEDLISKIQLDIFFIIKNEDFKNYYTNIEKVENNDKVLKTLTKIYGKLKTKMEDEFKNFNEIYFNKIKEFVKKISPTMDIFEFEGTAKLDKRGGELARCGYEINYNGEPCTKSLSEGERQVVALAFFFTQLNQEQDKSKIIVLDDPITTFDAGKRKSTSELIKKETEDYKQLFIFTCDPLFRVFCLKEMPDHRNLYYIFKTLKSSAIHRVPNKKETIYISFENDFENIDNFNGTNENIVIFGQKLRFCLETKIKEDYFGYSQDSLSNMIKQVAGQGPEKFEKLIESKDIILQIYSYCNTGGLAHYPRDGATSWNELKDKIQQYLDMDL